jgi:hypothetical protein
MIPDYKKGKEAAIRILALNKRQTRIDPTENDGLILVRGLEQSTGSRSQLFV